MNSKTPYGESLADKVYDYLCLHSRIAYHHYGYCGVGLVKEGETILYTHIDEWLTYQEGVHYHPGGEYLGIIQRFTSKASFIDWLAQQSDDTLSGKESGDPWYTDNQRLSRHRLEQLLATNSGQTSPN